MATEAAAKTGEGKEKRLMTMLAVAVAHPIRTQCFAILAERVASPAEIARELLIDVNQVGYHVRLLGKWGLIEEVDSRPVRGATEHFFQARTFAELTDEEEETQKSPERRQHAENVLSMFNVDAVRSIDQDLLYGRTDHFLTRLAYDSDEQGWEETRDAYRECWEKVKEIEEATAARLEEKRTREAVNGDRWKPPLRMLSFLGMFEIQPLRTRNVDESELTPAEE